MCRPPELLLGAPRYGPEIDIWSVGCIFAELLFGKTLFNGQEEADQLNKIIRAYGTPTEKTWPGVTQLP
jgi:cyclin-dependent kinase 12/13